MVAFIHHLHHGDACVWLLGHIIRNFRVEDTPETRGLAEELFDKFDEDQDGYWSLKEASRIQEVTEGSGMQKERFDSLILALEPEGGTCGVSNCGHCVPCLYGPLLGARQPADSGGQLAGSLP